MLGEPTPPDSDPQYHQEWQQWCEELEKQLNQDEKEQDDEMGR